jgi:hypothetical protein
MQGELWRSIAQFKSWPVGMIRMAYGREFYGQERAAAWSGAVQMFVAATVLGAGVRDLKDLFAGREPRDPADPKTWVAAIVQGGGGIYGDFVFGEFNRFRQNPSETSSARWPGRALRPWPIFGTASRMATTWRRPRSAPWSATRRLSTCSIPASPSTI